MSFHTVCLYFSYAVSQCMPWLPEHVVNDSVFAAFTRPISVSVCFGRRLSIFLSWCGRQQHVYHRLTKPLSGEPRLHFTLTALSEVIILGVMWPPPTPTRCRFNLFPATCRASVGNHMSDKPIGTRLETAIWQVFRVAFVTACTFID